VQHTNAGINVGANNERRRSVRGTCFWYPAVHIAKAAASCRYRIGNLVEHLCGADVVIGESFPRSIERRLHTVCVVRPFLTPSVASTLGRLQNSGLQLVGDFDDLLFAGAVSGLPRSVGGTNEATKSARLAIYARALEVFDRFTVSTRALVEKLAERAPDKPATLVPNGLSARWVEQGRALYGSWQPGDPKIIRYFAGSPSHDRDFAAVSRPLGRFLHEQPSVRLEVLGPVKLDDRAFPGGQVALGRVVPYENLPQLLATTWVSLAPLARSEFTECKSAIKFLEAGAFGCPTLASPNDDLLRHEQNGAPVLACRTDDDWHRHLTAMLDPEHRLAQGRAAASYVESRGMARSSAQAWIEDLAQRGAA
jgi:hypothetical protein